MSARRSHFASVLVAAALLLSAAAPALSDPKGGQGGGQGGGADNSKRHQPTPKVQGKYIIRIAGYYTGSGTAQASADGIKISARVKDPSGKEYSFQSGRLDVVDDRFSGTGTLDGTEVRIDGRLDPRDGNGKGKGNEVLKNGRMTFTFGANGRFSRGAGDQRQGGGN